MMTKEEWLERVTDKTWYTDFQGNRNPLEPGDQIRLTKFRECYRSFYGEYLGRVFEVVEVGGAFYFKDVEIGKVVRPEYGWNNAYFELVNGKKMTKEEFLSSFGPKTIIGPKNPLEVGDVIKHTCDLEFSACEPLYPTHFRVEKNTRDEGRFVFVDVDTGAFSRSKSWSYSAFELVGDK